MRHHSCKVYRNFSEFSEDYTDTRKARKIWKRHTDKHGNSPMLRYCSVCSGDEFRISVKRGYAKHRRPSKRLRDEINVNVISNLE